MKRPERAADGTYTVKGKKYKELFGSREQVMNGTAYKTEGLLTIDDLVMNKRGRIVSKKKYKTSKQEMRLEKYGYGAKKGKFGYVRIKPRQTKKQRKTSRGRKIGHGPKIGRRRKTVHGGDDSEELEQDE
jgi:hypothetical protein